MNKLILSALLMSMVVCLALGQSELEDSWYGKQEVPCLQEAGLCILYSECKQLLGLEGQLCPQQAAQGFQCCKGLPKNERRCHKHAGECTIKGSCKPHLLVSEASDCEADQDCCVRV